MTSKELHTFLKEHLVPSKLYKLNGSHNGRICMDRAGDQWEVYFSDHKQKVGILRFEDEQSACLGMKDELRKLMEQMYGVSWKMAYDISGAESTGQNQPG